MTLRRSPPRPAQMSDPEGRRALWLLFGVVVLIHTVLLVSALLPNR